MWYCHDSAMQCLLNVLSLRVVVDLTTLQCRPRAGFPTYTQPQEYSLQYANSLRSQHYTAAALPGDMPDPQLKALRDVRPLLQPACIGFECHANAAGANRPVPPFGEVAGIDTATANLTPHHPC